MPRTLLLIVLSSSVALADGEDRTLSVRFPPSDVEGELAIEANYDLWIPGGVTTLRGVVLHQHGCGDGAERGGMTAARDLHWQALARKWNCALMGSSYRARGGNCRLWCDPRNGSDRTFHDALAHFAEESGHPELTRVPWCLWGHSGGGFWASLMLVRHPERIVAVWLRSGTAFDRWESGEIEAPEINPAAYRVPVMSNPGVGERDHERFRKAWNGGLAMFRAWRKRGAPIGFAPDPRTSHECGDSRYLAIPYFDACLSQRLPRSVGEPLRPVDDDRAWLAPVLGETPTSAGEFDGDRDTAVWLPNAAVARAWREYVTTGATSDSTPPPPPTNVSASRTKGGVVVTWIASADFESGLGGFVVLVDGKPATRLPEKPSGRFGRPLFQGLSYHDTPIEPVPDTRAKLPVETANGSRITVVAVNSVGLESRPSVVVILGD